ncbi:MAG: phosphatidylserine decarboxylase family protein [Desulfobacterales bacterium]
MMNEFMWPDKPNPTAFPVARPGFPIIVGCAFTTTVLALLGLTVPALSALAITLFVVYFFRDPDRIVPNSGGTVVSPADGKVIAVETLDETPLYEGECKKISIFMSVFNVHVNRIPHEGTVKKIAYHPGKFIAANRNKASSDNERNAIFLETEEGSHITVVQIAGLIARRIICTVGSSQTVRRGQRLGMICFGSRVDLYVPPETEIGVAVGEHVKAGFTIMGVLP